MANYEKKYDDMNTELQTLTKQASECSTEIKKLTNVIKEPETKPRFNEYDIPKVNHHEPPDYSNIQFNHDVVLLVDSNLSRMHQWLSGPSCNAVCI